jgi:hypothetical protein
MILPLVPWLFLLLYLFGKSFARAGKKGEPFPPLDSQRGFKSFRLPLYRQGMFEFTPTPKPRLSGTKSRPIPFLSSNKIAAIHLFSLC